GPEPPPAPPPPPPPPRQEPQDEGAAPAGRRRRAAARLPRRPPRRSAGLGRDVGALPGGRRHAAARPRRGGHPLQRRGPRRPAVRRLPRPAPFVPDAGGAGRHRPAHLAGAGRALDAGPRGPLLAPPPAP